MSPRCNSVPKPYWNSTGWPARKKTALQPAYPKDMGKAEITAISFAILRAILGKKDKLLGIQRPETQAGDWRAVHMKTEVVETCINSTTLERRVSCTFVNYRSKKGELNVVIFFLREKNIAGHLFLNNRGASEEKGNLPCSHWANIPYCILVFTRVFNLFSRLILAKCPVQGGWCLPAIPLQGTREAAALRCNTPPLAGLGRRGKMSTLETLRDGGVKLEEAITHHLQVTQL